MTVRPCRPLDRVKELHCNGCNAGSENRKKTNMNADKLFSPGSTADLLPEGDPARQAVDFLRGYAYQVLAAALEWVDIDEKGRLFLEVAEDYASVAEQALKAVQVKDTEGSGSVTLNSGNIRDAVAAYGQICCAGRAR